MRHTRVVSWKITHIPTAMAVDQAVHTSCEIPSWLTDNQTCYTQSLSLFSGSTSHWSSVAAFMQSAVLLVICAMNCAMTLWLLGVVSGLMLPIIVQKTSKLRHKSPAAGKADSISDESSSPGLQSRPLSDVDADEVLEDDPLLSSSDLQLPHLLAGGLSPQWHVTQADFDRFMSVIDPVRGRLLTGDLGPGWNFIMEKEQPGRMQYASFWRPTANGKTDYLSITIINGTTAQEVQEFTLDDASRVQWDPMLKSARLLQSSQDVAHSCEQLVVWLRSFPMGVVSDRLYAGITRHEFADPAQPGCLCGVSKVVHTPSTAAWAALNYPGVTLTDDYFSAWECRTILSPWADTSATSPAEPQPACALILLHHDDLKVPEYLARTAIRLGMWKFVQGMVGATDKWLQQRRARVDPFQPDPQAACRQHAPPLSPDVAAAAATVTHRHAPSMTEPFAAHNGTAERSVQGPATPAAATGADPPVGLANGPNSSWVGLKGLELQGQQPLTPRVLVSVPTAPGPLHLLDTHPSADLGTSSSFTGTGLGLSQGHRRGHSLEWEPRVQGSSSSSSSTSVSQRHGTQPSDTVPAASSGVQGQDAQQAHSWWQRLLQGAADTTKRQAELGSTAAASVAGAVGQLLRAPAAGVRRLQAGRAHQGGGNGGSNSSTAGRLAKQPNVAVLAPAGPEDDTAGTLQMQQTAAAATAAAAFQQGASSGAPFGTAGAHGEFGSSQSAGRGSEKIYLHRLLVAAGVTAAVGAGVAAHHRRGCRVAVGATAEEQHGLRKNDREPAVQRQQQQIGLWNV